MLSGLFRRTVPRLYSSRDFRLLILTPAARRTLIDPSMPVSPAPTKRKAAVSADGTASKKKAAAAAKPDNADLWSGGDGAAATGISIGGGGPLVNPKRMRPLKKGPVGPGPVIYWMSRDQRMADNWALIHAAETAAKSGSAVAVAFNIVSTNFSMNLLEQAQ